MIEEQKISESAKEALQWEPKSGERERPENLWKILMKIPYGNPTKKEDAE